MTAKEIKQDARYQDIFERFVATADQANHYELVDSGARVTIGVPAWAKAELARFAATLETPEENLRPQRFDYNERVAAVDDASIAAAVKAAITADGDVNPFAIDVDVNDGVVTLSGSLGSAEARSAAEKRAREVDGVRRVINLIKLGDSG